MISDFELIRRVNGLEGGKRFKSVFATATVYLDAENLKNARIYAREYGVRFRLGRVLLVEDISLLEEN